ncbi:unnamed protein product [Sympodiomycopsis kandeliae]
MHWKTSVKENDSTSAGSQQHGSSDACGRSAIGFVASWAAASTAGDPSPHQLDGPSTKVNASQLALITIAAGQPPF